MIYIILNTPKSVENKKVENEIRDAIRSGYRTNEIFYSLEFVAPDYLIKDIAGRFQVLKNRVAFNERNR